MTSISINDDLLNQVLQTSGLQDKKQAVIYALQSFINKENANKNRVDKDNADSSVQHSSKQNLTKKMETEQIEEDFIPVRIDMERMQRAIDDAEKEHYTLTREDCPTRDSIRQAILNPAQLPSTETISEV